MKKKSGEVVALADAPIEEAILHVVSTLDAVSFAELREYVSGATGEMMVGHGDFDNMIMGVGLSEAACAAISSLREKGKIHFHFVKDMLSIAILLNVGAALRFPIAEQARNYKKPHWLPTFIVRGSMGSCSRPMCMKATKMKKKMAEKKSVASVRG